MGNVHTNFSLIVYIFPRKIFLISMRKETGKLSEKIRQIQKGNKEEIVEVINQFDPLIKKYQRSSTKYLEERLKLTVNREKSRTVSVFAIRNFKFLGFALGRNGKGIYVRVHPKSWKKFKSRLKELSSRKQCQSIRPSLEKTKVYARGWLNYYGIASMKSNIDDINGWLYHRIRMCIWKQWKKPRTKYKNLVKLGIPEHYAATIANSRRKYWYISNNKAVIWALNKERLINSGYYDLATAYQSVHVNY